MSLTKSADVVGPWTFILLGTDCKAKRGWINSVRGRGGSHFPCCVKCVDHCVSFSFGRFLLVMPGYSAGDNALAVKLVTGFPENEKQGLPSFISNIMVLDPFSGVPQAVS